MVDTYLIGTTIQPMWIHVISYGMHAASLGSIQWILISGIVEDYRIHRQSHPQPNIWLTRHTVLLGPVADPPSPDRNQIVCP